MSGRDVHRRFTTLMSVVLIVLGIVLIVRTITAGGGPLAMGMLLGVLFMLAGAGRLWVSRSTP